MPRDWQNRRWWREPENTAPAAYSLFAAFDQIESRDKARMEAQLLHAQLYGGGQFVGFDVGEYYRVRDPSRITMNLVRSVIDTLMAKITKNKTIPTFITEFGEPSHQRKAKLLSRFCEGAFYRADVEVTAPLAWRDGAIVGTGSTKVYSTPGSADSGARADIHVERVFPWELFVDQYDAIYGKPRCLYQTKLIDKQVLQEIYPKHREAIERAKLSERRGGGYVNLDTQAEQLRVVEAWRLPSSPKAGDGRHIVAIENEAPLLDEEWKRSRFPFSFYRYSKRQLGFWGQGIAELLSGRQYEINSLLMKIQEGYELHGRPIVFVPKGSGVSQAHLTDELDLVVEYLGEIPPTVATFPVFPPEIYQHLAEIIRGGYEEVGVSVLSARAEKPAGLDAAVALREYNDIESERFLPCGRDYEAFRMDIAELILEEAASIEGYAVTVADNKEMLELNFSDVNLQRDAYVMKMFPSSSLPRDPAGKLAMLQELSAMGAIEQDQIPRLLDMPDLDAFLQQKFAPYDLVDRILERIEAHGEYHTPEPEFPLEWSVQRAVNRYTLGKLQGLEEDRLRMLLRFKDECMMLIKRAAPPAPAPGAMPPGPVDPAMAGVPPPAPPMMPPGPPPGGPMLQ